MKRWIVIHKIKSLYDEGKGYSVRQIAKELSISRNTATKYLKMNEEDADNYMKNSQRHKELDEYIDYIKSLLQRYPKLTAVKIKKKLHAKGKGKKISARTFRRYIKQLKSRIPVMQVRYYEPVIDTVPGVQCQVDIGQIRNVLIGGGPTTIHFCVFVLSYSRIIYACVSDKPIDTKTFIKMHDETFSYLDGVPEECVYDQTKLVAIKEEFREVWFNEEFYRYATFARFDLRVCEGYDPESKGKVEAGVKYVKNNFFYGEEFISLADMKQRLKHWIEEANLRIHGTTKKRPKEEYEQKEHNMMRPYLRPSIIDQADPGQTRRVDKTSLISYKSNKYSVPMKYQSCTVRIKQEGTALVISDIETLTVIATHNICERKGEIIKNNNHYRDYAKLISDKEKEIGHIIGSDNAEKICKIIKRTSPKIYKDQLAGLIKILKDHDEDNLTEAISALLEKPRLKVTFVRDFLDAFYSKRQSRLVETDEKPTGILSAYGSISAQKEVSGTWSLLMQ